MLDITNQLALTARTNQSVGVAAGAFDAAAFARLMKRFRANSTGKSARHRLLEQMQLQVRCRRPCACAALTSRRLHRARDAEASPRRHRPSVARGGGACARQASGPGDELTQLRLGGRLLVAELKEEEARGTATGEAHAATSDMSAEAVALISAS